MHNLKRRTQNAQRKTHSAQRSTHNARRTTHNAQHTMQNAQCKMHNLKRRTQNAQRSTHSAQRSSYNTQHTTHHAHCTTHNNDACELATTTSTLYIYTTRISRQFGTPGNWASRAHVITICKSSSLFANGLTSPVNQQYNSGRWHPHLNIFHVLLGSPTSRKTTYIYIT